VPILYRHIRLDTNQPFYIGIGRNITRAYTVSGRSAEWKSIYESTDIEIEILFVHDDWEVICEKEKEFIAIHGRQDLNEGSLVNKTSGGSTGTPNRLVTYEEKMKISNALKGRFCGNKNPFYGKTHTEENKKKFSRKGSKHSIETKLLMSESRTGSKNIFYGKKHSEETIVKMSYSHKNITDDTRKKMKRSQEMMRWVKNGSNSKRIHVDELDTYLMNGWSRGRILSNIGGEIK
jgi:hypothetical protein